jgi:hypothetical protein
MTLKYSYRQVYHLLAANYTLAPPQNIHKPGARLDLLQCSTEDTSAAADTKNTPTVTGDQEMQVE